MKVPEKELPTMFKIEVIEVEKYSLNTHKTILQIYPQVQLMNHKSRARKNIFSNPWPRLWWEIQRTWNELSKINGSLELDHPIYSQNIQVSVRKKLAVIEENNSSLRFQPKQVLIEKGEEYNLPFLKWCFCHGHHPQSIIIIIILVTIILVLKCNWWINAALSSSSPELPSLSTGQGPTRTHIIIIIISSISNIERTFSMKCLPWW